LATMSVGLGPAARVFLCVVPVAAVRVDGVAGEVFAGGCVDHVDGVDSSVLKRAGAAPVRERVESFATASELGRPTICDLEVGYSAHSVTEMG
jgi:hypothetical protein